MKLRFIGDIHLGKRPSHSTRMSAHRHKQKLSSLLYKATDDPEVVLIQLGDLFDSYQVSNTEIVAAKPVAKACRYILAGNHDLSNNALNSSALTDLDYLYDAVVVSKPMVVSQGPNTWLHFVPSMPTQDAFIGAIADLEPREGVNILCLHTNVFKDDLQRAEIENNLPADLAQQLSEKFDLVVSGHEHNRCIKHGVHMVGSVMPMSFGEMTTKSVLCFDTDTKEVSTIDVWDSSRFWQGDFENFMKLSSDAVNNMIDFIEVTGNLQRSDVLPLVKKISELFNHSDVTSIRNNTVLAKQEDNVEAEYTEDEDWQDTVCRSLTAEQVEMFHQLLEEMA